MRIVVQLFGTQARDAGCRDLELLFDDNVVTCQEVIRRLIERVPTLAPSISVSRLAVNHQFAQHDTCIREKDEVALIGLIGGG